MDEFIDELLREDRACDVILPRIQVHTHHLPDECISTKLRIAVNHVCFHLVTQFYTPLYTNVY